MFFSGGAPGAAASAAAAASPPRGEVFGVDSEDEAAEKSISGVAGGWLDLVCWSLDLRDLEPQRRGGLGEGLKV